MTSSWSGRGLTEWAPETQTTSPSRALVLGGGGATGIAWLGGLILGLRERGIDLRGADTIIGTSAGSVVGTHLRLDTGEEEATADLTGQPLQIGKPARSAGMHLARALLTTSRPSARALVGKVATSAHTADAEAFVQRVGGSLVGVPWPDAALLITAVDVEDGTPVVFTKHSGVPLERAVAASCAVPSIFPPVPINGRRYMDGGVRSVANVDLAAGHDRVLVLAPIPMSFRPSDAPARQARALRHTARTRVVIPDRNSRRVIGTGILDLRRTPPARDAGYAQAGLEADRIASTWS